MSQSKHIFLDILVCSIVEYYLGFSCILTSKVVKAQRTRQNVLHYYTQNI